MSLAQFLSIIAARWKLALSIVLFTLAVTLGMTLLIPKSYTASSSIVVQVTAPDPVAGVGSYVGNIAPMLMASQVDIINSDRVAQQVVRMMKLGDNDDLRTQWKKETEGKGSYEAWLGDLIQQSLEVAPSPVSNVIAINYRASDARFAAAMANAFTKAYLDTSVALRAEPAKLSSGFFDERARLARGAVEHAQTRLSEYQKANGIVATDERLDVETARLNELSSQLVAVQAIAAESSGRQAQAGVAGDRLQDVLNNGVVSALKADLSRQESELSALMLRLGDAHPQVQAARSSIAGLQRRIASETARVASGADVTNRINRAREGELRAAMEAQRERVLKIKAQRDGMASLLRDVENAQRAYDMMLARLTTTQIESQAPMQNIAVLSAATEPGAPSSPNLPLNMALALFMGVVFAIGTALMLELGNRKVRSIDDVLRTLDAPVLGLLPHPSRKRLFNRQHPSSAMQHRLLGWRAGVERA